MSDNDEEMVEIPRRSLDRIHERNRELDKRVNEADSKIRDYDDEVRKLKALLKKLGVEE